MESTVTPPPAPVVTLPEVNERAPNSSLSEELATPSTSTNHRYFFDEISQMIFLISSAECSKKLVLNVPVYMLAFITVMFVYKNICRVSNKYLNDF